MAKYNSMFDVAFTVEHDHDNPEEVPVPELIAALERRLVYLKANPIEAVEAFGHSDTYETELP
jgi:hypothetical protein